MPVNVPKTAHMTEQIAQIPTSDVAALIAGGEPRSFELSARRVLDIGNGSANLAMAPVRPPRDKIPTVSEGPQWLLAKRIFERSYLGHVRSGRKMPAATGW